MDTIIILSSVHQLGLNFPCLLLSGSTEELKRSISEFQAKMQDKQEELDGLERQQAALERDIEKLGKQKSKLLLEQGKLQQEAEVIIQCRVDFCELVEQLSGNILWRDHHNPPNKVSKSFLSQIVQGLFKPNFLYCYSCNVDTVDYISIPSGFKEYDSVPIPLCWNVIYQ